MRWSISLALALSVAACRQTIVLDQHVDGGGGGGGGADSGPALCTGPPLVFTPEAPEVIVALDRSLGMATRFGDTTVLVAARDAIAQQATRYQNFIRFGYVEFPGSGNSCSPQPGCCASTVYPPVVNFAAFDIQLHACDQNPPPSCSTTGYQRPTTATLYGCNLVFARPPDPPRERYVLLVSNGRPDCGTNQNSGCMDAQNMADQLARNRVRTIVVAPGQLDPDTTDCLAGIAIWGGSDNPPYLHPASNPTELTAEIGDITRAMAKDACQLDLTTPIQNPDHAAVFWNDTQIPRQRSGTDGWELSVQGFEVVLHGKWCDRLVDDGPDAFALFANCDPQR
jgi:hypothetical protein